MMNSHPPRFVALSAVAVAAGLLAAVLLTTACGVDLPGAAPTDPPAPTPAATLTPSASPTSGPLLVAAPTALPGLPQLTVRAVPSDLPKV